MTNRISHFFEEPKRVNKFEHIEFEKFDPRIIQNVVRENSEDDIEENDYTQSAGSMSQKIIVSQDSQMLQTLNLWIGHCDIGITNKLVDLLESVEGIETLDIISKYRFRVGIGKLFKEQGVKDKISKTINSYNASKQKK